MTSRRFKFVTFTIVASIALTLAAGSRALCACTTIYPLGFYLGVSIPEEIDDAVLREIEQAANSRVAGKSILEVADLAEQCRQDLPPGARQGSTPAARDAKNYPLIGFVCGTPLLTLAGKSADQLHYNSLKFQVATFSNMLWEDQIAFTLLLDKQVIQQVKAAHTRRLFHIPRNFFESLVN